MTFEMGVVLEQLCYTGMLETIRIRKIGYPIRYRYNQFIKKYRPLIMKKDFPTQIEAQKEFIGLFLSNLDSNCKNMFQLGTTKVSINKMTIQSN
jgi:myosin-15